MLFAARVEARMGSLGGSVVAARGLGPGNVTSASEVRRLSNIAAAATGEAGHTEEPEPVGDKLEATDGRD